MNGKKKDILMLGFAFLSILLLVFSASPAMARGRDSRPSFSHRDRDSHRSDFGHRDYDNRSRFGIGFGFGSYFYPSTSSYWVPGYYQTHTEQVLVEPAHYEWQTQQVQVEPGRYEVRQIPAVEETRRDE